MMNRDLHKTADTQGEGMSMSAGISMPAAAQMNEPVRGKVLCLRFLEAKVVQ